MVNMERSNVVHSGDNPMIEKKHNESGYLTSITFSDDEYEDTPDLKTLDIGVDTSLVGHGLWAGDDIELLLKSTTLDKQSRMLGQYFMDKYLLEIPFVVVQYLDSAPLVWCVQMDAQGLTEQEVVSRLQTVISKHNSSVKHIRKQFYSRDPYEEWAESPEAFKPDVGDS